MIQEGGISPLLGRFKGIPKKGLPRESSEAIRVGKGGTTKRTRPAACGRVRDVKFVPTQTPPLPFSFYRQRLFLCRAKKKGLKRLPRTPCANSAPPVRYYALRAKGVPRLSGRETIFQNPQEALEIRPPVWYTDFEVIGCIPSYWHLISA